MRFGEIASGRSQGAVLAISRHLGVLERGAAQRLNHYRQYWEAGFDRLARYLEATRTVDDDP